ncbi:TetR/AcrR family transcriptional regulator [uncultured Shewanella sp.]|uniref:TetR/AcrR family transcriptional regulator n=1 Tax=Shewanella atlantica TaxID=271099 RepID=UPI0026229B94|nr:TetR/AcrR family transcriptional regulator [uncultured Shewanella sp.]
MAKRSKAHTEQTINQILDEVLSQLLTLGYGSMSYTTLSDATGISRTGISHHFPRKVDFLTRLDPNIARLFIDGLDFSSLTRLESSWMAALEQPTHAAVLRLFFSLCGYSGSEITQFRAISLARETAVSELGAEGDRLISDLLGRSAVALLAQTNEAEAA